MRTPRVILPFANPVIRLSRQCYYRDRYGNRYIDRC
jgi:hypothetical protein